MHPNKHKVKILVVDDNEDDVILLQEAINKCDGVELLRVLEDGQAAIHFLQQEEPYEQTSLPDIILLDINMPKRNGFEVLQMLKADDSLLSIPTIILTSSDREEDIQKAYRLGASTYLKKPFDFDALKSMAQKLCEYWSHASLLTTTGNNRGYCG